MAAPESISDSRDITPGSLTITWATGGTTYTLTDDSNGNLTGDGSGTVKYYGGVVVMKPDPAPRPVDGHYEIDYAEWNGSAKQSETTTPAEGTTNYTLLNGPVRPGSLIVGATVIRKEEFYTGSEYNAPVAAHDDGNGNLIRNGETVGTVNYATGAISFDLRRSYTYNELESA